MTLRVVLSALVAAGAAYFLNRLSRRLVGRGAVVFVAPGLEESFKTGAALVAGAPVLAAHLAFGGLEAVYDLLAGPGRAGKRPPGASASVAAEALAATSRPWARPDWRRVAAAAAGLGGHALFGSVTVATALALGSWPAGVGVAYLLHVGWNALVMGRVRTRR